MINFLIWDFSFNITHTFVSAISHSSVSLVLSLALFLIQVSLCIKKAQLESPMPTFILISFSRPNHGGCFRTALLQTTPTFRKSHWSPYSLLRYSPNIEIDWRPTNLLLTLIPFVNNAQQNPDTIIRRSSRGSPSSSPLTFLIGPTFTQKFKSINYKPTKIY